MKKILILLLLCLSMPLMAKDVVSDTYEIDTLITKIDKVRSPYVSGDFIVFTAECTSRHVGIAFDFEGFKSIHSFQKLNKTDMENEITDSIYFYILPIPKGLKSVGYRLIIDGLWTLDPLNKNTVFDADSNIMFSKINLDRQEEAVTCILPNGNVRFVYHGESGQNIRLGGSFTNWDSSIYTLKETKPEFYELELLLPKGTYFYSYYTGIMAFIDKTNPERAYSKDGKTVSMIIVE